jgi:hypothetical protein
MPRSFLIKKNNYSNCPLKKRPVPLYKEPQEEEGKGKETTTGIEINGFCVP